MMAMDERLDQLLAHLDGPQHDAACELGQHARGHGVLLNMVSRSVLAP